MIDDVIAALEKDARFSAWQVTQSRGRSTQRYQVFADVEARRAVDSRACDVRVHLQHEGAHAGTMGESSFTAVDARTLPGALDAAFARASLVHNKPWTLPSAAEGGASTVRAVDARIIEAPDDAVEEVGRAIEQAVRARSTSKEALALSASEVFCDHRRVRLRNSRGLDLVREDTSAYTEYVLLAQGSGTDELEVYQSRRARSVSELALEEQIEDDVAAVRAGARAVLPHTGIADVVIGGSGTEELFDAFVAHASGASAFDGWSRFTVGQPILQGAPAEGFDRLSISADATLAGGLGTFAFDDVGLPGKRIDTIVDGVFRTRACDQRYACWLGAPATGTWGNTVVAPGSVSEAVLLQPSGARPLYQLLRFSQLSPHATTGAFSGEVRFGWRIDADGTRTPIRGGSVSGNVFDAFARARLSREVAVRGRMHGPRSVRLDAVQVTGAI